MTNTSIGKTLTIIPTYNEIDNLGGIISRLHNSVADSHVLIVDDGSPDGTGELADSMAASDERIHVIHRTGKLGLGSAYIAGFTWGLERGYDLLVEMDADGSHPPETLPKLLELVSRDMSVANGVGLAIGSRWTRGGRVVNWPKRREILSRGANVYARLALGIAVRDSTAGYRVYSSAVLRRTDLQAVNSLGYCFQIDLTLRTLDAGFDVVEVPIVFREREFGESKMSGGIVVEAMTKVTVWGAERRYGQLRRALSRRAAK